MKMEESYIINGQKTNVNMLHFSGHAKQVELYTKYKMQYSKDSDFDVTPKS